MTHPTVGPLFGSAKVQFDYFLCPMRLYQGLMQMNLQGIGLNVENIKFPQIRMTALDVNRAYPVDNQQINPSSIFSYLGMRGLGTNGGLGGVIHRDFNAMSWLAYWEIYKQYYANKQEGIGAVIHTDVSNLDTLVTLAYINDATNAIPSTSQEIPTLTGTPLEDYTMVGTTTLMTGGDGITENTDPLS